VSQRPRATARERGYSVAWEKARKGFLAKHPWCECPDHKGKSDAPRSDTVDHVIPHMGDKALFWLRSNWCAMSAACHSRKTATEDGGFGNHRRAPVSVPASEQLAPASSEPVWLV
jgi:5-methylcytosine-specific restriction protein A